MELEIISPGGVLFKGETDYVSFPGTAGSFDVLPHHAPMTQPWKKALSGTRQMKRKNKK